VQRTGSQEPQRIAKLLARAGVASRREIERMIAEGRVALDGQVLDTPATLLGSLRGVTVDGVAVKEAAPARLFLFHKPAGVLTAAFDPKGRATIYDRLPDDLPRLMPVGRLDLNTEGLLLLTTDGELKRQLELPATGVERAYRARAYGDVTQAQLEELIDGVEVEGVRYGPIDANLERRTGANVWVEMVLTEGKNREVRRVLEHLGLQVSRLIRTRYGPFILGDLPVSGVGEVRQVDLIQFRASLKGNKAKATEEARANPVAVRVTEPKPVPAPAPVAKVDKPASPPSVQGRGRGGAGTRSGPTPATRPASDTPTAKRARPTGRPTSDRSHDQNGTRRSSPSNAGRDRSTPPVRTASAIDGTKPAGRSTRASARSTDQSRRPEQDARGPRTRTAATDLREDIATRPRRARPGPVTEPTEPKPRPKRGAGWAKAKPKSRPGKPRKPRA